MKPTVSDQILDQLTHWFPMKDFEYRMDKSYEEDEKYKEIKKEEKKKNTNININIKEKSNNDEDNTFIFLIAQIAFHILIFVLILLKPTTNVILILTAIAGFNFFATWLYSITNIVMKDFKKDVNKVIWIILIIVIPISCFLYPYASKNQKE